MCGRIGHAARECPEEVDGGGGVQFGTTLRCSPQKRDVGKRITIPAVAPVARKGLHFSGAQREKVMEGVASSNTATNGSNVRGRADGGRTGMHGGGRAGSEAAAADLAKGVASMSFDSKRAEPVVGKERVSGLDSFVDSSDHSTEE